METYCHRDSLLRSMITSVAIGTDAAQRRRQQGRAYQAEKDVRQSWWARCPVETTDCGMVGHVCRFQSVNIMLLAGVSLPRGLL